MHGCGYENCDWPIEQTFRFDTPTVLKTVVGAGDFDPPITVQPGDSMSMDVDRVVVYRQGEARAVYRRRLGLPPAQRWQLETSDQAPT